MSAQRLKVADQIPGAVLAQLSVRPTGAAAALVDQHDAIALRIEEAPHRRVGAAAGAAVQEYDRLTLRVAAFLVVQFMQLRDAQVRLVEWPDRRIQRAGSALFGCSGLFGTGRAFGCGPYSHAAPAGRGAPGGASAVLQIATMGPSGLPPSRWRCRWETSMP